MAAKMVYLGAGANNDGTVFVYDYVSKKNLAKLGYRFPGEYLTDVDVEAHLLIAETFAKCEKDETEKQARKNKSGGKTRH